MLPKVCVFPLFISPGDAQVYLVPLGKGFLKSIALISDVLEISPLASWIVHQGYWLCHLEVST